MESLLSMLAGLPAAATVAAVLSRAWRERARRHLLVALADRLHHGDALAHTAPDGSTLVVTRGGGAHG